MSSSAESRRAPGCIAFHPRHACVHEPAQQVPIAEAVRVIQAELRDYEDSINAEIAEGRTYYVNAKIHSADCPTVKGSLRPTESWHWVTETSDPDLIEEFYAEAHGVGGGGGFYVPGRLLTREQAAQSTLKRCMTCAPDVVPRVGGKRSKKVAGLGASDLGRTLDGHRIESITHEPGVVIVRTSAEEHRFDTDAAVTLDVESVTAGT
ncbi:hypothetical protein ACIGO9_30325 [Nocardia asteroides]|uniref:hypothetical protein n=1 Tax=Nocardia asteroides TaxID=1824 RepID=UPI0037C77BDA